MHNRSILGPWIIWLVLPKTAGGEILSIFQESFYIMLAGKLCTILTKECELFTHDSIIFNHTRHKSVCYEQCVLSIQETLCATNFMKYCTQLLCKPLYRLCLP